jgi:hypothetical protein
MDDKKGSWNSYIVAHISFNRAVERLDEWKVVDEQALQGHWYDASRFLASIMVE